MEKIVEYFSHDTNANQDPKMMLLIAQLGLEGYGIFWVIIEYLAQQPGYKAPILMLEPLSRRFGVSKEKFEVVVKNYGLFEIDESTGYFFSNSLLRRLSKLDEVREKRRAAILKRWQKNTNELQMYYNCNTIEIQSKVKESKVKESKVKESKVKESKIKGNNKEKNSDSSNLNLLTWIIEEFSKKYFETYNLHYSIANKGKERTAAALLIRHFKEQFPKGDTAQAKEMFSDWFDKVLRIDNKFYQENMSLPVLASKFNEINKILSQQYGKKSIFNDPVIRDQAIKLGII